MIEIFVGLLLCTVVTIGVNVYRRWFVREGPRHPGFERWCRTEPLVVALRVAGPAQREVLEALRHLLAPGEFKNRAGRFPWQHYLVRFERRRLQDDVVGIAATDCVRERVRDERTDIAQALLALGRSHGPLVEELWIHGELHGDGRFERAKMGWVGRFADDGALVLQPMIGQPEWLPASARAA